MTLTFTELVEGIRSTLAEVTEVAQAQGGTTVTDGMNDLPALQVYLDSFEQAHRSGTDRTTFRGGIRETTIDINVDVYARQRSHIGEDMAAVHSIADAIQAKLEEQDTAPFFGLTELKSFRYRGERVTFVYGDTQISYAGLRIVISCITG